MLNTSFLRCRKVSAISIVLALLISLVPTSQPQAQTGLLNKLSAAVQQELGTVTNLLWSDSANQRMRVIVQTNGPVSTLLMAVVGLLGGNVVRRFSSINGMLVE